MNNREQVTDYINNNECPFCGESDFEATRQEALNIDYDETSDTHIISNGDSSGDITITCMNCDDREVYANNLNVLN